MRLSSNGTATSGIYTLSLHDALPIFGDGIGCAHEACEDVAEPIRRVVRVARCDERRVRAAHHQHRHDSAREDQTDRKSTRLNSSHGYISYAVFCLKKKKTDVPLQIRQ